MRTDIQLPKWTERTFNFGYSNDFIPFLAERLSATAPRIAELIANATDEELSYKPGSKWSAKEHIGHLTDLEELHTGRLDDFQNKSEMLRAADMRNRKTEEANHNAQDAVTLLAHFRTARKRFFKKLQELDDEGPQHKSVHPRLKYVINVADMLYFMAEHDNHHLTAISMLLDPGA